MLAGLPNVSYDQSELLPAKEKVEKWIVRAIIDKKIEKKVIYYKVWFKKHLKADSTWESKTQLLLDGLDEYIKAYEDKN